MERIDKTDATSFGHENSPTAQGDGRCVRSFKLRQKSPKLVVTFPTNSAAMAMDGACGEDPELGRLIPVPQSLSAGCGFAWLARPEQRDRILSLMREGNIAYQEIAVVEMY